MFCLEQIVQLKMNFIAPVSNSILQNKYKQAVWIDFDKFVCIV